MTKGIFDITDSSIKATPNPGVDTRKKGTVTVQDGDNCYKIINKQCSKPGMNANMCAYGGDPANANPDWCPQICGDL